MARHTKEDIRNALANMERGKGIVYFNRVCVTFNMYGEFDVFNGVTHMTNSTTTSLNIATNYINRILNQ